MRNYSIILLLLLFGIYSCKKDPEPEPSPEEDRAYITLYNFLSEPFEVKWEVDEVELEEDQPYGSVISGGVLLEEESEEIVFVVKNGDSGAYLESQTLSMTIDKHYLALVYGTAENPVLLCEELETKTPTSSFINIRFLHASVGEDTLDVYTGGTSSEKQLLSGLFYGDMSEYDEVSEYDVRASVIVTLHDTVYKEENELISFEYNDLIQVNSNYLSVIAPESNTDPSDLTLWLYLQPKE
jgi:hypothetical protein